MLGVLAALVLILTVGGCGSDDTGGGVGEFRTVVVGKPQVTSANPLLSDVAKWTTDTDGNTIIEKCVDTPTVVNDSATVTITSTSYGNSPTASDVSVMAGTLVFTAADTISPALPTLFSVQPFTVNQTIGAGGSKTISVELVNHAMKSYLQGLIACSGNSYKYFATISFDIVEVNTNVKKTVSTQMDVRFADFVD